MSAFAAMKAVENQEALLLVLEDLEAKKLLVAWTLYGPMAKDRPLKKNETGLQAYWNIWSEHMPDYEKLSNISGLPFQTTIMLSNRLRAARMLYPDGTIPESALRIIRAEVGGYIKNLIPKTAAPKNAETKLAEAPTSHGKKAKSR